MLSRRGLFPGKPKNRDRIAAASEGGRLTVHLRTEIVSIAPDAVILKGDAQRWALDNDAVIVCAGGILPTDFLRRAGIQVETKFGTA